MDNAVGKVRIHNRGNPSNMSGRTQCVLEGRDGIQSLLATTTMSSEVACFFVTNVTSQVVVINIAS